MRFLASSIITLYTVNQLAIINVRRTTKMRNETKDIVAETIQEHVKITNEPHIQVARNLRSISSTISVMLETKREIDEHDKLNNKK